MARFEKKTEDIFVMYFVSRLHTLFLAFYFVNSSFYIEICSKVFDQIYT